MRYDITSKVLIEKGKLSLFRYFQKRQPADIELIELQPQEMPNIKKGDCILKVTESSGAQEIQVWEFKTQWNTQDILNLMDYTIRAKQTYRLPVKPVLFLFVEHPKATGEYQDENFQFRFDLIKLWEEDAQSILDSEDYFLYPLIPVMKGEESLVFTAKKKLYNSNIGKEDKSDLLSALTLFAGLRDKELCIQLFKQRRDLMIESHAYEVFRQDAMESARKEVRQEALKQGLKQGAVLKMRNTVLNALRVRFQDVPTSIQIFIEGVEQENTLDLIFEKAIIAASLPEFGDFIHTIRS